MRSSTHVRLVTSPCYSLTGLYRVLLAVPLLLTFAVPVLAQSNAAARSEALFTFSNGRSVTIEEFEQAFAKQMGTPERALNASEAERRAFLQQYIDFSRKVLAGEAAGVDTTQEFKAEYQAYIRQLAQSYLVETEILERLENEAIKRSREQVYASHLLVALPAGAHPDDTLSAYRRARSLRDSIVKFGRRWEYMVSRYSDDPNSRLNRGDLGFFGVFEMLYPFESAAYETQVGKVSMPIRTQYGYHLIRVEARIPDQRSRRVSQIVTLDLPNGGPYPDSLASRRRAEMLYRRLRTGEPFQDLVECCSEDPQSVLSNGDMGFQHLSPQLEMAKALLKPGEFSPPVRSKFGWHILYMTEEVGPKPEQALRASIRSQITRDGRVQLAQEAFLGQLRRTYKLRVNKSVIKDLQKALGAEYFTLSLFSANKLPVELLRAVVFRYARNQEVRVRDLLQFRTLMMDLYDEIPQGMSASDVITRDVYRLADSRLLEFEKSRLPQRYPAFRALSREYHHGMVLFAMMEQNVWQPAQQDEEGLRRFYADNMQRIPELPSFRIARVVAADSQSLVLLREKITAARGRPAPEIQAALDLTRLGGGSSARSAGNSQAAASAFQWQEEIVSSAEMTDEEVQRFLNEGPGFCTPPQLAGAVYQMDCLLEVSRHSPRDFEVLRPELVQAYQQYLERQWLARLREQYPATIHEDVFRRAFRR